MVIAVVRVEIMVVLGLQYILVFLVGVIVVLEVVVVLMEL